MQGEIPKKIQRSKDPNILLGIDWYTVSPPTITHEKITLRFHEKVLCHTTH